MRGCSPARRAAAAHACRMRRCCRAAFRATPPVPGRCSWRLTCGRLSSGVLVSCMLHALARLVRGLFLAHMGTQQAMQRACRMHARCAMLGVCRPRGTACGAGRSGFWSDGLEMGAARPRPALAGLSSVQACRPAGSGRVEAQPHQACMSWGVLLEERGPGALPDTAHTERGGVLCAPAHAGGSGCRVFCTRSLAFGRRV